MELMDEQEPLDVMELQEEMVQLVVMEPLEELVPQVKLIPYSTMDKTCLHTSTDTFI